MSPEEQELYRIELEEQRLMQEINKVDEVVGLMKNDYDRIRLQALTQKTNTATHQSIRNTRPPSARGREPKPASNSVVARQ